MVETEVEALCREHGWSGRPGDLIASLCRELLEEVGARVPVDVAVLASARGVSEVREAEQEEAGCILFEGDRLVIQVRARDPETRRRFTVCHEICHTFFPALGARRVDETVGEFSEADPIEYLCDVGAAELLMPRQPFCSEMPEGDLRVDDVLRLADCFRSGPQATSIRLAGLHTGPFAVVSIERAKQNAPWTIAWSATKGTSRIARGTAAKDGPVTRAGEDETVEVTGEFSFTPGRFRATARLAPYGSGEGTIERVLAVLVPA